MLKGTEQEGGGGRGGGRGQLLFLCRFLMMFDLQKNEAKLCAGVILTKTELIFKKK